MGYKIRNHSKALGLPEHIWGQIEVALEHIWQQMYIDPQEPSGRHFWGTGREDGPLLGKHRNNQSVRKGGIVTDGCRGKLYESMLDFIYVEGVTSEPIYWET